MIYITLTDMLTLKGERLFVAVMIGSFVTLSLLPTLEFLRLTPPGATFPLVHNYVHDFYSNLSYMHQGWEGNLLVTSRYTPEPFPPQFISTALPLLGMVARVLHLSLPMMYTVARILFGIWLLFLGYTLARTMLPHQATRLLAFLFMILGAPLWYIDNGIPRLWGAFWSGFDPLVRVTFLPHHLLANCLFILSLLTLSSAVGSNRYGKTVTAAILAALSGWANPAMYVLLFLTLGVAALIRVQHIPKYWKHFVIFLGLQVIPIVYLYRLQFSVFPFTTLYRDTERFWIYPINGVGFLKVMGAPAFLAIIGLIRAWRERSFLWALIVGWLAAPFVGLELLQRFLPLSNARYLQGAYHIPTAILAAPGIAALTSFLGSWPRVKRVVLTLIVMGAIVATVPSFEASVKAQRAKVELERYYFDTYISTGVMDALAWLNTHGEGEDVVLAPYMVSMVVPPFTNKRTVVGSEMITFNVQEKVTDYLTFYSFADIPQAQAVLARHKVAFVLADPPGLPQAFSEALSLVPVFTNEAMTIYAVR